MAGSVMVMRGRFDRGISLDEVLRVVGISRQWMEVILHEDARPKGRILCKSGQVITASAGPDRRGVEAFVSLYRRPTPDFVVYRRPAPREQPEPIGTLSDLVAQARNRTVRDDGPSVRSVILEGSFAETPLLDVLDVVELTRQLVELAFRDDAGTCGAVLIKAGRVLAATSERSGTTGRDAFLELIRHPGRAFAIVRRAERVGDRVPIGRLSDLVAEAIPALPTPVLAGHFGETRVTDLLDSIGRSGERVEIRLSRDGRPVGRIELDADRLLDVVRGPLRGRDAFRAILDDPGTQYRVIRRERTASEPVGTLGAWLAPEPGVVRDQIVLEGTFADASIAEVLGTFSLTRQHIVAVFRSGGQTRGRLTIAAGRVLDAEHDGRRGPEAFRSLLLDPGDGFVVYRLPPGTPSPEPIGRLQDLLESRPEPDEDVQPTVVLHATGKVITAPSIDISALEVRLDELSGAIASLERMVSIPPPTTARWPDRMVLLGMVSLQIATLVAAAAPFVQVFLGR